MFSSYLENPKRCKFEGQDDDEDILLLLRAHPITNLSWITWAILLSLLPFIVSPIATMVGVNLSLVPQTYITVAIIINILLIIVIVFEGFLYWYFNVNLVTSKRIVDIDFENVLSKNIDLAQLEDIQEANSKIRGVLGLVFNFGDVVVQTAGATIDVDFFKVPNPDRVADLIMDEAGKLRKEI